MNRENQIPSPGRDACPGPEPQVQGTFGMRVVDPGFVLGGAVENILARLPGTNPDGAPPGDHGPEH